MNIIEQLNSAPLYLICGFIILCVIVLSVIFMLRAYRAGLAIGMDKIVLKRTITSSATFTVLPSISILLGVIALSGSLGTPLPWLRLSVIGALHYETSVADVAARAIGLSGLNASEMTLQAFSTIALLMGVGIIWGTICSVLFTKGYLNKIQSSGNKKKNSSFGGFGDMAMSAMFIGLISAYIGSYMATLTSKGNAIPLLVLACSGLVMSIFMYFIDKKNMKWLENFSVAGSMLVAMACAVLFGLFL
ncbi:MAG: DUF5058 family protein [Christensenellaceae bacterium]|nr:DUF5058 family protein [Christensenellaceae bacterium]